MFRRLLGIVAMLGLLLSSASPAMTQSEPAANVSPRLVVFEGFYNPS